MRQAYAASAQCRARARAAERAHRLLSALSGSARNRRVAPTPWCVLRSSCPPLSFTVGEKQAAIGLFIKYRRRGLRGRVARWFHAKGRGCFVESAFGEIESMKQTIATLIAAFAFAASIFVSPSASIAANGEKVVALSVAPAAIS